MQGLFRQLDDKLWPILTGPVVVYEPVDGNVTGPPGGTGPPQITNILATGSAPPRTTDPPLEWLVRKKTLKKV